MKVSKAIREGIKLDGVQVFNKMYAWSGWSVRVRESKLVGCCALGAFFLGLRGLEWAEGYRDGDQTGMAVEDLYMNIPGPLLPSVLDMKEPLPVSQVIIRLNDTYRWSREAIADYLESVNL